MSDLVTTIAAVTRRLADEISAIMGDEPIDVGGARAGHEICEQLSAAGLPFRCVGGGIPANIGTHRGLANYLLQQQTNELRDFLQSSSPQALVLTSDWTLKPPTRLYPMGNGPRIVHRVCVVAHVNGQVIDPRLPLRREDLDKLEQIFAVLVFDGAYVDEVEAPPITDQPQPEMPPQIAAFEDTSGYKPRKLRQRRTRRVAA